MLTCWPLSFGVVVDSLTGRFIVEGCSETRHMYLILDYRLVLREVNPNSIARTAAWVRSETPSLRIIRSTCTLAVPLLMVNVCAICWLVCPVVRSPRTSVSRGVSASSRGSWRFDGVGYRLCCFSSASCLRSRVASSWLSGDSPSSVLWTALIRRSAGGVFEHVAGGAGIQRFEQVVGVLVHGHHEYAYAGLLAFDPAGRRDAVHLGHADVHKYEIRRQTTADFYGLEAGRRFADHFQSGLAAEQAPESSPEKVVIVSEDEPLRFILHGGGPPFSSASRPQPLPWCRILVRSGVRTSLRVRITSRACRRGRPSRRDR